MLLKKLLCAENKNYELKEQFHNIEVAYNNFKKQIDNLPGGNEAYRKLQETKRVIRDKNLQIQVVLD